MLRSCLYSALLAISTTALLGTDTASGQEMVLSQMYGSGVHAYFSCNYQLAMADLTSAIDAGSKDPRNYYFRGLAELRMGMEGNAEQDFQSGAHLEAQAIDRFYPISRSLERVQGLDRIVLERYRAQARAIAYQEKQKYEQSRYERLRRAEESVLRAVPRSEPLPPPVPDPPTVPVQPKATEPAEDPFGEAPAKPAEKPAVEEDPFGDNAPPAADMPKEEAPPAAEDDPFAADGAEKKPVPKPPVPNPPAADEDPFADDAPAEKPAAEKPAADEDPFGG